MQLNDDDCGKNAELFELLSMQTQLSGELI
jgi:hypothetical protein